MKKKLSLFILFFLIFFINISFVRAESCANINTEISNYNAIDKKLSTYDCSKDTDSEIVKSCNKLNLQKSNSITKLYRLKEKNPDCKSEAKKIDKIIEQNSANCTKISDGLLESFTDKMLLVFYIIGPILVILFSSLDYTKAIMSNDKQALKKTSVNFVKRLSALIILFIMPVIVNIITGASNSEYILNGDGYSCKSDFIVLKKTYSIAYVPAEDEADSTLGGDGLGGGSASAGAGNGNFLKWKQFGSPWSNIKIGSSTVSKIGCKVTSTAIQIANAGAATNASSFNPGVLVNTMKAHGGFTSGGGMYQRGWETVAPNFKYKGRVSISGSAAQKAKTLATYINRGFYPVIEVKKCNGGQHWVSVISVNGTTVTMADPGYSSSGTNLAHYNCFTRGTSQEADLYYVK